MTFDEIYERVTFYIYGDQEPPLYMTDFLTDAPEGVICNVHKRIQEEFNYWFMEAADTISVIAGTREYDLHNYFKNEVMFNFYNSNNVYLEPLIKLRRGEADTKFRDKDEEVEWPSHYNIWGNKLVLYPMPKEDKTLNYTFYGYLPEPTLATFNTHHDDLTNEASDLIVAMACIEVEQMLEHNPQNMQTYQQKAAMLLRTLRGKHREKTWANLKQCEYKDV